MLGTADAELMVTSAVDPDLPKIYSMESRPAMLRSERSFAFYRWLCCCCSRTWPLVSDMYRA